LTNNGFYSIMTMGLVYYFNINMNKEQVIQVYLDAISKRFKISKDLAFEILAIVLILGKSYDEVVDEIWTGRQDAKTSDCGFDGIFIDEENMVVHIFQTKNSPNLKENELDKLKTDYRKIFIEGNTLNKKMSPKIKRAFDNYRNITDLGKVLRGKLYFVYNGENDSEQYQYNQELFKKYNDFKSEPNFKVIDSTKLYKQIDILQATKRKVDVEFSFNPCKTNIEPYKNQGIFSFQLGQVNAVSFRMSALQLGELVDQEIEKNETKDFLFSENIRGFLETNQITNRKILETLKNKEQSFFFPFLNNGLTIICQKMDWTSELQNKTHIVKATNPVIVNGLQTANVIYQIYKEDRDLLEDVYLIVKLYETENQNLIDLITEATNTQSAINYRDQMSNKKFNKIAEDFFASKGIRYVSKRGEVIKKPLLDQGVKESISSELAVKFWYATYNKKPHIAKNSIRTVLREVFLATKYEEKKLANLFSGNKESKIYEQLFTVYRIYKLVANKRKGFLEDSKEDFIFQADEIIAYGIYKELEKNNKLENFSDEDLKNVYLISYDNVKQCVKKEQDRKNGTYSHNKYFKSERCLEDYNEIIEK